jgi:hypothetical protein
MTVWFELWRTALMDRTAFPYRGCSAVSLWHFQPRRYSNCTQPSVITEITYGRQGGRLSLLTAPCLTPAAMVCVAPSRASGNSSVWSIVHVLQTPSPLNFHQHACRGQTSSYLCHLPWCPRLKYCIFFCQKTQNRYQHAYAALTWLCTVHCPMCTDRILPYIEEPVCL